MKVIYYTDDWSKLKFSFHFAYCWLTFSFDNSNMTMLFLYTSGVQGLGLNIELGKCVDPTFHRGSPNHTFHVFFLITLI